MKHSGLWRMAVTSWRRVGFLAVFAAALGTFCLAVALNGFLTVRQEKGAPCQMAATASALDEAKLSEVKKLEGVLDATLAGRWLRLSAGGISGRRRRPQQRQYALYCAEPGSYGAVY